MTPKDMIAEIGTHYPIIVRTQYHVQIPLQGGYHDLWLTKQGLRVKLMGQRDSKFIIDVEALIKQLTRYNYDVTDEAALMSVQSLIRKAGTKKGIFVDAGFKQGISRLCVVRMHVEGMDICVRYGKATDNMVAESEAINLAIRLYPGEEVIYTDCQSLEGGRIKWLPRKNNKEADKFASMKGK